MAALADEANRHPVGRRHRGAGYQTDRIRLHGRPVVHGEDRLAGEAVEHTAVPDAALSYRPDDQCDRAVKAVRLRDVACSTDQHRPVAVMATAVHGPLRLEHKSRSPCYVIGSVLKSPRTLPVDQALCRAWR